MKVGESEESVERNKIGGRGGNVEQNPASCLVVDRAGLKECAADHLNQMSQINSVFVWRSSQRERGSPCVKKNCVAYSLV